MSTELTLVGKTDLVRTESQREARFRDFVAWLDNHAKVATEHLAEGGTPKDTKMKDWLFVVVEPEHPRYTQVGQAMTYAWSDGGGKCLKFLDGEEEVVAEDGDTVQVRLKSVYKPLLEQEEIERLSVLSPGIERFFQGRK